MKMNDIISLLNEASRTNSALQGLTDAQRPMYSHIVAQTLSKYKIENGELIYRNVSQNSKAITKWLLDQDNFPFSRPDTEQVLQWLRDNLETINSVLTANANDAEEISELWNERYYEELIAPGWSKCDSRAWDEIKFTTWDGQTQILAPTGNGMEYRVIGTNGIEVYQSLASLNIRGSNRIDYVRNMLQPLLLALYNTTILPVEAISGDRLPASIASTIYKPQPVFRDGIMLGTTLSADHKPSVYEYVTKSTEVFLSNSGNYINKLIPVTNDPETPTLRFIDIDNLPEGECPVTMNWINTTFEDPNTSGPIFCAAIASIIVAKNNSKQVLWLHGHGNDGKTQFLNILSEYLGEAAVSIDGKSMGNQFGFSKLEGKRLVTISDSKDPTLIQKSWVHKVTGGDTVDVERKMKNSYKSKMIAKIIICENIAPNINVEEDNQLARLIYIKCRRKTVDEMIKNNMGIMDENGQFRFVGNSEFPNRLREEMPAFLRLCMKFYKRLCPTDSQIAVPHEWQLNNANKCQDPADELLVNFLENTFEKSTEDIIANDFWTIMSRHNEKLTSGFEMKKVKTMIENIFGATSGRKTVNGRKVSVICGISEIKRLSAPEKPKNASEVYRGFQGRSLVAEVESTEDESWVTELG